MENIRPDHTHQRDPNLLLVAQKVLGADLIVDAWKQASVYPWGQTWGCC